MYKKRIQQTLVPSASVPSAPVRLANKRHPCSHCTGDKYKGHRLCNCNYCLGLIGAF